MEKKTCPKCQISFAPYEFLTKKNGKKKPYCTICTRKDKRDRYAANPSKAIAAAKKWSEENPNQYKANQERYRSDNRDALNEQARVYRLTHPDTRPYNADKAARQYEHRKARAVSDIEFAKSLKMMQNKAQKKHYAKHRDAICAKAIKYRNANIERERERTRVSVRKHNKKFPEKLAATNRRRKALRRGAKLEGFDEIKHKNHLHQWQMDRCYHCNILLDKNHVDHYVPVVKKGPHSASNLVLSCPTCNVSKNDRIVGVDWYPSPIRSQQFDYEDEAFSKLCDGHHNIKLLSTFMISERNCKNASTIVRDVKNEDASNIILFDHEWYNRQEAVTYFVQDKLGKSKKLGARKTELVEVDTDDAREFFERYHLQGFGPGYLYLGLEKDGELVGCSSWSMQGANIELNRMAFKGRVAGGFSKMLKGLLRHETYADQPIFSFVDPRYAVGNSYEKVGFKYVGEASASVYYYVNGAGMYHRRSFMKQGMKKFLPFFDESLTENQNAQANGYYRVYGLKQKKYVFYP